MYSSIRNSVLLLLCFAIFGFSSCEDSFQDELNPVENADLIAEPELAEYTLQALPPDAATDEPTAYRRRACFTFVYPIEINFRDSLTFTAQNNDQLRRVVRRIRQNQRQVNFVYPFAVETAAGQSLTIETFGQFRRLVRFCRDLDDPAPQPCFSLNYPFDMSFHDTLPVVTIERPQQLLRALSRPGVTYADIIYPIGITYRETGQVEQVSNVEELRRRRVACAERGDYDDRGLSCYRVLFPVDLRVGDRTVTVTDRIEWRRVARLAGRFEVAIVYPITLVEREGDAELVVNSRQEWAVARDSCEE